MARMHRVMKIESQICVVLAINLAFLCVAAPAHISLKASTSNTNNFSGNGKNEADFSSHVSGQSPPGTNEASSSQDTVNVNLSSGDVSLASMMSGSGNGQQAVESTGKRAADAHGNSRDLGVPARAICPFKMEDDVSETREPRSLMVAKPVGGDKCRDPDAPKNTTNEGVCVMVEYSVSVQIKKEINGEERLQTEFAKVPVARVCVLDKES